MKTTNITTKRKSFLRDIKAQTNISDFKSTDILLLCQTDEHRTVINHIHLRSVVVGVDDDVLGVDSVGGATGV